ncbi:hypothetical protein [Paraburkholderia caribensis]|uniref:hypothetical protein n=1 Tax=Paraburkholderia caribensis TaxID=75105 RepID=UPI0028554246|nr:hypothetical protein [Paraburkholderia caribensis]MDR6384784.1 hypothetical protein [Paraburkholderia caribensis]
MFFTNIVVPFFTSVRAVPLVRLVTFDVRHVPAWSRERWAPPMTAVAARADSLNAPMRNGATDFAANKGANDTSGPIGALHKLRHIVVQKLRQAGVELARSVSRAAFTGRPLTPTGYAIVALMAMALAMVAMFSTSSAGGELESALRLSWWFC